MQAHGQEEMFMGHNQLGWSSQSSWMEFGSVVVWQCQIFLEVKSQNYTMFV